MHVAVTYTNNVMKKLMEVLVSAEIYTLYEAFNFYEKYNFLETLRAV